MAKGEAGGLNIVQGIVLKNTDFLRRIIAPAVGHGGVTVVSVHQIATIFSMEDNIWWVSAGKKHRSWWSAICGENCAWRESNRLLVVQTGESASQAKVFKAHAVPQGLCENSINALKLFANQQKDGDSPIQSFVAGLCERSRKGIMEGLRNFIKVENHCALEVGHLKEGTRIFQVRRPQFEEGSPEVSIREGPEEFTLRAEEVGSPKSVHHC